MAPFNSKKLPDLAAFASISLNDPSMTSPSCSNVLRERDAYSIEYHKSSLNSGDTLVIINTANDAPIYHASGFRLDTQHLVSSTKLLATGSTFFKNQLDPLPQKRIKARHGLLGASLPMGVKYVLDLTPPDEGDSALEIIQLLSCSLGIRLWYTSGNRNNVSANLVGGLDETFDLRSLTITPVSPILSRKASTAEFFTSKESLPSQLENFQDLDKAHIMESTTDSKIAADASRATMDRTNRRGYDMPDYCPARHRAAIVRLLQIIEGKDAELNSAVKIWTLVGVARYFDCISSVVDYVCAWVSAPPNCKFIEILPEKALQMGFNLENAILTRAAFAILVSEEALRLAADKDGVLTKSLGFTSDWTKGKETQKTKRSTKLGRPIEDLDDDLTKRVQYAGRSLSDRIEETFVKIFDPQLGWLQTLPEYTRLLAIERSLISKFHVGGEYGIDYQERFAEVSDLLRHYIRGRLFRCFLLNLDDMSTAAVSHRLEESYLTPSEGDISNIYERLSEHEKINTHWFWQQVKSIQWSVKEGVSIFDPVLGETYLWGRNEVTAAAFDIKKVTGTQVSNAIYGLNTTIELHELGSPIDFAVLLKEVSDYLMNICSGMLKKGENHWSVLCDTVLDITDEEYKYLPLWAGGLDDGSGGVYGDPLPPAEKGGAIGPGPSYHTGSTLNSTGSSVDEDGESWDSFTMSGDRASLAVRDSYDDSVRSLSSLSTVGTIPASVADSSLSTIGSDDWFLCSDDEGTGLDSESEGEDTE